MKAAALIVLALLLAATLAQGALAQQNPAGSAPASPEGNRKTVTPEQFLARKTRILKMIEERRTRLEQAKTCVEAAKNDDDLQKCRPERPMEIGPGGMRQRGTGMQGGGPRGQQPMMPPAGQQQ